MFETVLVATSSSPIAELLEICDTYLSPIRQKIHWAQVDLNNPKWLCLLSKETTVIFVCKTSLYV